MAILYKESIGFKSFHLAVEAWLKFIGITDVHSVIVEKTILGEDVDRRAREDATQQARRLADSLTPSLQA